VPTVFFAFRDAPDRRAALRKPVALDRYRLFGLDDIRARGADVRHNLERDGEPPAWSRIAAGAVNGVVHAAGGYGGDFAGVLPSLRTANAADVVFSTGDTVGIPLLLLKRFGRVRTPLVHAAIGLPERLQQLRHERTKHTYRAALRTADTVFAYAQAEADWLRDWIGDDARVDFVPFGVDVDAFAPQPEHELDTDVVSIGADPRRDFGLLTTIAARHPELSMRIVASREHVRQLGALPQNVTTESDLTLEQVRDRLAGARVVALPVRRNSYSGATTVLLQAMALAKPVVVSRTDAIAEGYALQDGVNCRLVEPEDGEALESALLRTLADPGSLGARARETVERDFSWERYTSALWDMLSAACRSDRH
jgi:glycosyltransferase involved in cell wall biosynthesis